MTEKKPSGRTGFFRSIVFKNILLFLFILFVAVLPLAFRYYQDIRDYEVKLLASRLEVFAKRGATWLDPESIHALRTLADKQTEVYQDTVQVLSRIEKEFEVDNAVLMRRREDGSFEYIAVGGNAFRGSSESSGEVANPCSPAGQNNPCSPTGSRSIFDIGRPVHIHSWFPATYQSTEDTWQAGQMVHSQLFGGKVGHREFDQFLQINTPLKLNGRVVAILMLNKFAEPVAEKVWMNTLRLVGLTAGILALGLILFGVVSSRMLRLLQNLTSAAEEVSHGNLEVTIPKKRSSDEVGRLAKAFENMIGGLEKANRVKDEFLSVMSHELRTPLNVVVGYSGMMLDGMLGEINQQQKEALQKIINRAADQLTLVNNILYATVLEAGKIKIESHEVDLKDFLHNLNSGYDIPTSRDLIIKFEHPSKLPVIRTDGQKLKQILQNLIDNAVKFTEKGTITISARYIPEAKAVEFEVADTGVGISKGHLPLIFDKFRQVDSSETRLYGGVGMGLYIVGKFTEMLGGTVDVESELGKGSAFTVTIPLQPSVADPGGA